LSIRTIFDSKKLKKYFITKIKEVAEGTFVFVLALQREDEWLPIENLWPKDCIDP